MNSKQTVLHKVSLEQDGMNDTAKEPHDCKTCKKKFKCKSDWKRHERIHTGEVPYKCKTCMKRFTQKCDLSVHERIHTGELPYECKSCKKIFSQVVNFSEKIQS